VREQIQQWLGSGRRDFAAGVALYAAAGKSRVVARSLAYGETDFTRGLLERELQKLLEAGLCDAHVILSGQKPVSRSGKADSLCDAHVILPAVECHATATQFPTNVLETSKTAVKSAPQTLSAASGSFINDSINPQKPTSTADDLRRQRSTWFAERDRLHAQLELVATDEQRRVMTMRILALAAQIAASYDEEAGRVVPAPVAAPRPDLAAIADAGEIRRLLANLRPQASKLKHNPARASDLAQVRADILLLETKLKA